MPLSFVIFGAASAIATPYVNHEYDGPAYFLLIFNIFVLIFGIYLAMTHKEEPYWLTLFSIMIGIASVFFYGIIKYKWVQDQRENNQTIFPQFY